MTTPHRLVRHGDAGNRAVRARLHELSPLMPGRSRAAGLVALLEEAEIMRILSSPYARCVETVEPLATERAPYAAPGSSR